MTEPQELSLQAADGPAAESAAALPAEALSESLEDKLVSLLLAGEPVVLLSIVRSKGSAPRHAGTRALYTARGPQGTVGGGQLEARAFEAAEKALHSGQSSMISCELSARDAAADMVCGGSMDVLCEVLRPEQAALFALGAEVLRQGGKGIWVVDVSSPEQPVRQLHLPALPQAQAATAEAPAASAEQWQTQWQALRAQGLVRDNMDAAAALLEENRNKPALVLLGERSVYVEPLDAPPVLLLCGGGHIALEVAMLAHNCGFVVDVVDDREAFSTPRRFPMARRCFTLPDYKDLVERCGIGRRHYVAIISHAHSLDREALAQALSSHAFYIGMIGSQKKRAELYAALRGQGVPDAELAAVRCPIGLNIGAESPQQLAVAIVAELLAARAGTLQRLRFDE